MFIYIGVCVNDIRAIRAPKDLFFLLDRYTIFGSKMPTPSKKNSKYKIRNPHTILTSKYQADLEAGIKKIDILDFFSIHSQ